MSGRILIAGALARRPDYGGHAWALLHWALGFERLGWDVLWVDSLEGPSPESPAFAGGPTSGHVTGYFDLMERFDLADACALRVGNAWLGRSFKEVLAHARGSDLLLNIMGYLNDPELREAPARRVFLDVDPGFGHMWCELGLADLFDGHDAYVTVGLEVGREGCTVPTCGYSWIGTLPPVLLTHWPPGEGEGGGFRGVASWRGPFAPIDFEGERYGLRVHQFRRFLELPRLTGARFELALDIDPEDAEDLERLRGNGWRLVDPKSVAGDPDDYRRYVRGATAELMIAKDMYVRSRSGWFSDRSACFLASGRPVLAQDTGLPGWLPTGEGLVVFQTPEEAVDGWRSIVGSPARHRRAARSIAETWFDSDRVLERLLSRVEVRRPVPGPERLAFEVEA